MKHFTLLPFLILLSIQTIVYAQVKHESEPFNFSLHPTESFKDGNTLTNAFADYDNDGDLDLYVGFSKNLDRLYRNDKGTFVNVAEEVGIVLPETTRASSWGDFNNDGHMDLFVGGVTLYGKNFGRLFKNDGNGKHFTDVTANAQINVDGSFRQISWIDYDNDGDVDIFIGLRDKPNMLYQNNNGKFTNVAPQMQIDDSRKTVGAVWFDFDKDGDLDCYNTNMDGDANGFFRNDGTKFVDIALALGLADGGRPLASEKHGTVRPSLGDYDNDGNFDIYTANYGPNGLFHNLNGKLFENVAVEKGVAIEGHFDAGAWGDYDNNGLLDLYLNGTVGGGVNYRDYFFQQTDDGFTDITPQIILDNNGDHGVQWVDFDEDGDLDLALNGALPDGMHHLLVNNLPKDLAGQSLKVVVLDGKGHFTRAGSEVRLYKNGTKTLLGSSLMDTGSGYNSQNAMPVHFGLRGIKIVDVEVTVFVKGSRKSIFITNIKPEKYVGGSLVVKIDANGKLVK